MIKLNDLILEGGASGHLAHIFESGNLTFSEIDDIFKQIFSGKIELKEKIDGFAFSVTMKNGQLYSARSKTELRNPLNFEQTVAKFEDRMPAVKMAFINSFQDMANALGALSTEQQNELFNDGQNWLSFEIISQGAKNIVDYGDKAIIILHGIDVFDDKLNKVSTDPSKAKQLEDYLDSKGVLNQATYTIRGPVALKIKDSLKASEAYNEIHQDLTNLLGDISFDTKLVDYVAIKIKPELDNLIKSLDINLDDNLIRALISRCGNALGLKLVTLNDLYKMLSNNIELTKETFKSFIDEVMPLITNLVDKVTTPIWALVVKAGSLLFQCLSGFLSANPSDTAQTLSKQLDDVLNNTDFQQKLSPNDLLRFQKALTRLNQFNKQTYGTEGVVFNYKGKIYKLTSTFGPLNQLLGLFMRAQYARTPSATSESTINEDEPLINTPDLPKDFKYVVYLPGSFKPPHLGHINMIRTYATNKYGEGHIVKVIISAPVKSKRLLDNGKEITAESAKSALDFMIDKLNLTNVETYVANNPISWIYDDIVQHSDDFKHTIVIIGCSTKDGANRYNSVINSIIKYLYTNNINQEPNEQTLFVSPNLTAIEPVGVDDKTINASDLRSLLSTITPDSDIDELVDRLASYLPSNLTKSDILTYYKLLNL